MKKIKVLNILVGIIMYVLFLITYDNGNNILWLETETIIFILSWVGIILYLYILYSWYTLRKRVFDIYTILITIFMLFNYGQPILWALGIHVDTEIGQKDIFGKGIATDQNIIQTQMITLICIYMYHLGALLYNRKEDKKVDLNKETRNKEALFFVSKILSIIVIPVVFYSIINKIQVLQNYGYLSLYDSSIYTSNIVTTLISRLFLPCLAGLLIGSNYDKKIVRVVFGITITYTILVFMSGARGSAIYIPILMIFMYNYGVKKINLKKAVIIALLLIALITISSVISDVRAGEITLQSIVDGITNMENNSIISAVSEMGTSMHIQSIIIQENYDIYPYGNSYVFAFLGIISDGFIELLNIEYVDLSTWFSRDFLELGNWGAGFSLVGELLINYGPYVSPLVAIIIGNIVARMVLIVDNKENSLRMQYICISYIFIVYIYRGAVAFYLKEYIFNLIVFFGMVYMYKLYINSRAKSNLKQGEN